MTINHVEYAGHLYGPDDEMYLFLGVDRNLLSYQGFMDYVDMARETITEYNGNQYILHPDGVLVVIIHNPNSFLEENHIESMGVGLDEIALTDIDSIRGNSFKRYIKYLLDKCYGRTELVDGCLKATNEDRSKIFVTYHVRNAGNRMASWNQIEKMYELMEGKDAILVTNLLMPRVAFPFSYIDRSELDTIERAKGAVEIVRRVFLL